MKRLFALLFLLTTGAVAQVPTVVQYKPYDTSASGTNNPLIALPTPTVGGQGHTILVSQFGATLATGVMDSAGNTYALCTGCSQLAGYGGTVWAAFNAASATSVTIVANNGPKGSIVELSGATGTDATLSVNTPATLDNHAATVLATGGAAVKGLVVQGAGSQTANLQEW